MAVSLGRYRPAAIPPLGFPQRLKIASSSLGFFANVLQVTNNASEVLYEGSNCYLLWGKVAGGHGEIYVGIGGEDILSSFPAWSAGTTTIPRTGWENDFVISEAITTSVTITTTTPQTFTYNASAPSISFSNNQSLSSDNFGFNPPLVSSVGTRTTTISLNQSADYVATNSASVSYTINKKNVTIALTSQSSTYAPNQVYSASAPVAITSLSGADTISNSFASLLTGVPATGANAGSYTISLNPNYTSTNYNITNSPASVTWTISKADQAITFNPSLNGTNGQTQNLSASSSSGLSVSFSVVSGPATLNGSTLTYTGTGNVVVRASQAGNTNYNPASNADRTISVAAAGGGGSGIPVASTNTIIMSGSGPTYIQTFGSGDANGSYTKQSPTYYNLDGTRYLYYASSGNCWVAGWSNGDNSYDWANSPQSSASFIPTNWDGGITIAPSNIPLSQANISLTGFSYTPINNTDLPVNLISQSVTLARQSNTEWSIDDTDPNNPTGYDVYVAYGGGQWRIQAYMNDPSVNEEAATNQAANTSIPVTGWVLQAGAGNSGSVAITATTFPNVATTSTVNALINLSDTDTTSYLLSVGFTPVGGMFSIPLTKQVPPSANYMSVEYKTTFNDGATCSLIHSTGANNKWFFTMQKFSYHDEEFGNQYTTPISIYTATGQSSATIPAARSSYSGTNINFMVSPNCFW